MTWGPLITPFMGSQAENLETPALQVGIEKYHQYIATVKTQLSISLSLLITLQEIILK